MQLYYKYICIDFRKAFPMLRDWIWLFPIAFILHDFEEIILGPLWLRANTADILARIPVRFPAFLSRQIELQRQKSASEFALSVCLIFLLVLLATFLANILGLYAPFLLATCIFFLHGFMHLGQAILLKRYVPALVTSLLVVIPYGLVLDWLLFTQGSASLTSLLLYALPGLLLILPFILVMLRTGEALYRRAERALAVRE
jgi:hypothetical protein